MQEVIVRQERAGDAEAIALVDRSAFGGDAEAEAVMALRQSKSFIPELSLVAQVSGRIAGHLLLFRIQLEQGGRLREILALAPMAVVPSQSHRGIGTTLLRAAVQQAQELGYQAVVIIGPADYYARFGFITAHTQGVHCPLPVPAENVTIKELVPGTLQGGGSLRYPPEFARLFRTTI